MKYFEFNQHEYYALIAVSEKEGRDSLEKAYEIYFEIIGSDSAQEVKAAGEPEEMSFAYVWFRWKALMKRTEELHIPADKWMQELRKHKDAAVIVDGSLA
ncbi:hypothetical protein [Bacillus thuringiensis]|uniref:hypothetical protein n=1 Tax=Bacillus thuringiensis TaxID=1428 RepID=UPI0021D66119|nr:hypothetical protein [Bacillus thuringiensis]MCU7667695.1 hypothetical protein [Bacillus thuringiensis]